MNFKTVALSHSATAPEGPLNALQTRQETEVVICKAISYAYMAVPIQVTGRPRATVHRPGRSCNWIEDPRAGIRRRETV